MHGFRHGLDHQRLREPGDADEQRVAAREERHQDLVEHALLTHDPAGDDLTQVRGGREQLVTLKEEVDRLGQPPSGYGVFLSRHEDGTVDIFTGGRKLRVSVSPNVEGETLRHGQEVMLNEAMNVVEARGFERSGDVVMLKELLEPVEGLAPRALVIGHTDEERVVFLADSLDGQPLRSGDSLLLESRSGWAYERVPKSEVWGVASHYPEFRLAAPGRRLVRVCTGVACLARGARDILDACERRLGVGAGHTTSDGAVTLEEVSRTSICWSGILVLIPSTIVSSNA